MAEDAKERYSRKIKKLIKHKQMIEIWSIEQCAFVDPETIKMFSELTNRLNDEIRTKKETLNNWGE